VKKRIDKENFIYFDNDYVMSHYRVNSKDYAKTTHANALVLYEKDQHLYETIAINQTRRFYFDIDSKDCHISYNDLMIFGDDFNNYFKRKYGFLPKFRIHLSYADGTLNRNKDVKWISSAHIIYTNIATKTCFEGKQILMDFLYDYQETNQHKHYFEKNGLVDKSVYKRLQHMRQLNQSKDNGKGLTLKYIYYCPLTKKLISSNKPTLDDLITYIPQEVQVVNVEVIERTDIIYLKDNVPYDNGTTYTIPANLEVMNNVLINMKEDNYVNKRTWRLSLEDILYSLHTNGIYEYIDVIKHSLIKQFLKNSRVGRYDTEEFELKNKKVIQEYVRSKSYIKIKQLNRDLIQILTPEIIQWINMNMENGLGVDRQLELNHYVLTGKDYYIITDRDSTLKNSYIYYIDCKVLCIDYQFITNNKKKVLVCKEQPCYNINILKDAQKTQDLFLEEHTQTVANLNDIPVSYNKSKYIKAPVGTGKTFLCASKHIKDILNNDSDAVILCVVDTITLTEKTLEDKEQLLKPFGYDRSALFYYKDREINQDELKIIITTYDSLEKTIERVDKPITYIIIDEIKNVLNRVVNIQGQMTILQKSQKLSRLLDIINGEQIISCLFMDADYDKEIHLFFKENVHINMYVYSLIDHIKPHKIIIKSKPRAWDEMKQLLTAGHKFIIASTTNTYAENILKEIQIYKNVKCVMINAKGATGYNLENVEVFQSKELKAKLISNPEFWCHYDVVIYTPTIITGVSMNNEKHFYNVFVYICNMSTDATQTAQLTHRARNTQTNEITVISLNINKTINDTNTTGHQTDCSYYKQLKNMGVDDYEEFNTKKTISGFEMLEKTLNTPSQLMECNKLKQQIKQNENTPFYSLMLFEQNKETRRKNNMLYDYMERNHFWGVRNITVEFFDKPPETLQSSAPSQKNKIINLSGTDFINARFLDEEEHTRLGEKYKVDTDDSQDFHNYQKTNKCLNMGLTNWIYDKHRAVIDDMMINRYDTIVKNFYKIKRLRYYIFNKQLYFIVDNMKLADDYDTELLNSKTSVKHTYTHILNLYCIFKVLEILGINEYSDLKKLLSNELMFEKSEDNLLLLIDFMKNNDKIITYLNGVNRTRNNKKDAYTKLSAFLTGIFTYIGFKFKLGRQVINSKKDKYISLEPSCKKQTGIEAFRLQTLMDNEEDDRQFYNNEGYVSPKIIYSNKTISRELYELSLRLLTKDKLCIYKNIENISNEQNIISGGCYATA